MAAKEIGGYLELERFSWPMLHEGAVALNCGRNALAYVLRARGIQKIRIPAFCCDTVMAACRKEKVSAAYYAITEDWLPELPAVLISMGMNAVSATCAASASSKDVIIIPVKVADSISSISQGIRLINRDITPVRV